ncbi:acetyltransferase [Candidatus Daviesbacteria bacterium RIFCSPHIGHO2_02_FULL_36_13]|uniref:Acetyltransferase n=1 Tax=Candidatus Daviesbacteria bacterium RIFCSPHIGHO2_02_FULL_36_13 TaxID=1797768 RepID=A0A1F5JPC2_9BACT|nr:MAG: acetyltransferase [Candidatus Daviesbacteria bacterium RIFCSPHIGHO2_02_FULL_36_13]OGE43775.1 MAG: acetyltransferase [Candidatus Daviesbacteria bacterium RIFCSPLOWO2_01_FULL_36_8]
MISFLEFFQRIKYWINADRIGPDIPTSYWKLFFKSTMVTLCKSKFKYFDETAEFRAGSYATGCSKISIGKRVIIRPFSYIQTEASDDGADITIEDDVMLGPGVHIYTNNHTFSNPNKPFIDQGYDEVKEVILKKGCWIGANVIILAGVTIGENSVIGAGSVVTKSIPDRTIAVGAPAKVIKKLNLKRK